MEILPLLIGIGIFIIVFIVLRSLMLWYWRVDTIVENQEKTNLLLKQILEVYKPIEEEKPNYIE